MFEESKKEWASVQTKREKALTNLNSMLESGQGFAAFVPKRLLKGVDRMTLLMDSLEDISLDKSITAGDKEILMFMISQCTWENWINIPLRIMSDRFSRDKGNISRSIERLVTAGYIQKEKIGRSSFYRFNPEHGWKGKDVEWAKVVDIKEIRDRQAAKGRNVQTSTLPKLKDKTPLQLGLPGIGAAPREPRPLEPEKSSPPRWSLRCQDQKALRTRGLVSCPVHLVGANRRP